MMDVQTSFVKMSAVPEETGRFCPYAGITGSRMEEGRPQVWKTVCCPASKGEGWESPVTVFKQEASDLLK